VSANDPPRTLTLGPVRIELHADGLTVTRFLDGASVPALAHDTQDYLERARAIGYGDDVASMSREHEIAHSLLGYLLTGGPSPVLWRVGHGLPDEEPDGGAEEAVVMALQRLARMRGISLDDVLVRLSRQPTAARRR
jgi:hypothetical protein